MPCTFQHFSLSILTAIFQVNLGYPVFTEAKMTEVMVTTGVIGHAKLQSNRHHQQINTQFFTGWMPFLSLTSNQQCQSTEGKVLSNICRPIKLNTAHFILKTKKFHAVHSILREYGHAKAILSDVILK